MGRITEMLEKQEKTMENSDCKIAKNLNKMGISTAGKTLYEVVCEIASIWNDLAD